MWLVLLWRPVQILGTGANWSTNLPSPVVVNGQNVVTNPIAGTQQFSGSSNKSFMLTNSPDCNREAGFERIKSPSA